MELIRRQLVEREAQLRALEASFADCVRGRGRLVLIDGPVASGKTELLQTFVESVTESGAKIRTAVASSTEQTLPLAVVGQLLFGAELSGEVADRAARMLREGARLDWSETSPEANRATAEVLHGLCIALLTLSERGPTVLVVDDAHCADVPSLWCLSSVVRRMQAGAPMVVLAGCAPLRRAHPLVEAELLCIPNRQIVTLGPLSPSGVATLVDRDFGPVAAHEAPAYHALAGGNPLLVNALLEDRRTGPPARPGQVPAGRAYADAVAACVYRYGPATLRMATALAILGEPVAPAALARLLGTGVGQVESALALLEHGGILSGGWFRHPVAASALLDGQNPARRSALHAAAARLLYSEGRDALTVARHLVLGERFEAPWLQPTLREAADLAVTKGDVDLAIECLRLAREASRSERDRAETTSMLARVEWRVDPARAVRHFTDLVAAVRAGHLVGRHAVVTIDLLLWHGCVTEACELLTALCAGTHEDPEVVGGLSAALLWLAHLYPEYAFRAQDCWRALHRADPALAARPLPKTAGAVLGAMLAHSTNGDAVAPVETLQRRLRQLGEESGPMTVTLAALALAERLCTPTCWCGDALDETRRAALCRALAGASRAEAAIADGDFRTAAEHARHGLDAVSSKGWGVALGGLIATAVLAATATGQHDVAARALREPVPDAMFKTPFGLRYLHARGVHHLAAKRLHAACADFQTCGDLMRAWRSDIPTLVPWRVGLARAYLQLGRRRQAEALAAEQLSLLADGPAHMRAATLRVLAAASEPAQRPALLRKAVDLLQTSARGNPAELADAFTELGEALYQTGDSPRAKVMVRAARRLARQAREAHGWAAKRPEPEAGQPDDDAGTAAELSTAERRVAELAAVGHTNREIADSLYVTVSTVEQHLTRVYRKLGVNRRSGLRAVLSARAEPKRSGVPVVEHGFAS